MEEILCRNIEKSYPLMYGLINLGFFYPGEGKGVKILYEYCILNENMVRKFFIHASPARV